MGLHRIENSSWVLDPRVEIDRQNSPRGIGNQISVEFNLLYRFHCAISKRDELWCRNQMETKLGPHLPSGIAIPDLSLAQFGAAMAKVFSNPAPVDAVVFDKFLRYDEDGKPIPAEPTDTTATGSKPTEPKPSDSKPTEPKPSDSGPAGSKPADPKSTVPETKRGGEFSDEELFKQLTEDMNDPIGQFGPLNIPNEFKAIEIMGILQARKWCVSHLTRNAG